MRERVEALGAPTALERLAEWLRSRAWIAGWWALGRALTISTALVVDQIGPRGWLAAEERIDPFGVLNGWDGRWYRMIAEGGYLMVPGRQSNPAFFPLYPLLLRGADVLGLGYRASGVLIASLALLGALVAVEALTRRLFDAWAARRATIYVAVFPLGYVFSMSYPQSIVLAGIALAALAAQRDRWALAAVCAAVATLGRPEGLFVALPIAAHAWQRRRSLSPARRGLALAAVVAPAAALASYPLYLGSVVGNPLAWSQAQRAWGRHFSPLGFMDAASALPRTLAQNPWLVRDVICLVLYVLLLVVAWRAGTSPAWLAAAAAVVVLPLFSGSVASIGRFGVLALPVFWALARLGRDRRADLAIRAVFVAGLVGATATIPYVFP